MYIHIIIIGIQPLGRFGQRPELSQATGVALVRCILGKFLGVVCHCFPLYTYTCICMYMYIQVCIYVCIYIRIYVYPSAYMYTYTHTHTHTHIYIYISQFTMHGMKNMKVVQVCIYIYTYTYIYSELVLISSYLFRLSCHHQGAYTYFGTTAVRQSYNAYV